MPEPRQLPHLVVLEWSRSEEFHRQGRGGARVRAGLDRAHHGATLKQELRDAIEDYDSLLAEAGFEAEELRASGSIIAIEAASPDYPLKLDSLEKRTTHKQPLPQWLLLAVQPWTNDRPETALVWVSDGYRQRFFQLLDDYIERNTRPSGRAPDGNPRNQELVANMAAIRAGVARDLWTSPGDPAQSGSLWWEVWLRRTPEAMAQLEAWAGNNAAILSGKVLQIGQRIVAYVRTEWAVLESIPFSAAPVAEIRAAATVDTIEDLPAEGQDEYTQDLAARLRFRGYTDSPAVCSLDTGARQSHVLLAPALAASDHHSVYSSAADLDGHGTKMAGLALLGPLDSLLASTAPVEVEHQLESVRIFSAHEQPHHPDHYPVVTAEGVAMPEITQPSRARVFSLAVTAQEAVSGEPTTWSAAVDALAAGVDIDADPAGISILSLPDPDRSRLFVVSAGNVTYPFAADYRALCDTTVVQEPAQSWNALTVGAYTELTQVPTDPTFYGWQPLAQSGDISPYSGTGVMFASQWPNKPDICLEGGNRLRDAAGDTTDHANLNLRSSGNGHDLAVGSINATSAATAQAARLAALAMVRYPGYWPETVRGLLVHSAEWTPTMVSEFAGQNRVQRRARLRRYGWGVPTAERILASAADAVTLVVQDSFVPFQGNKFALREFRLHELPWPVAELQALGGATVRLRVTLSYFVEPAATRRGWRRKFSYQSHGLRFEMRRPLESTAAFIRRVNREAERDEDGFAVSPANDDPWLLGSQQRNKGSLHADIWEGTAAELAECGVLAVHGVGGWWKNNARKDRMDLPVRYSLLVSLSTDEVGVDLYTPIAVQIGVPVKIVATTS